MHLQLLTAQGEPAPGHVPVRISEQGTRLGAAPGNDLVLPDTGAVSAVHAVISERQGQLYITDQGDLTPVWLNGKALGYGESGAIHAGDILRISTLLIRVCELQTATPDATASRPIPELPPLFAPPPVPAPAQAAMPLHGNLPPPARPSELDQLFALGSSATAQTAPSHLDPLSVLGGSASQPGFAEPQYRQPYTQPSADDAIDALFGIKK